VRRFGALFLCLLLNLSLVAAGLPLSSSLAASPDAPFPPGATAAPSASAAIPAPPLALPPPVAPLHPTLAAPPDFPPAAVPNDRGSTLGIDVPTLGAAPSAPPANGWYGATAFSPVPLSIVVGSDTSIILFVRDQSGMIQVPTDADLASGFLKAVGLANNTSTPFFFSAKLFETTVGNKSINASADLDLGVANQTLQLYYDTIPLDVGAPVITGNSTSPIPQPFRFANGSFSFFIPRLPDYGCGGHILRVVFDNQTASNNFTYYASSSKDFRIYTTCETTLSIAVDINPSIVNQTIHFYGTLSGSKGEAVPARNIQILMDGKLLGLTGAGAFVDDVIVSGTTFSDDFEDLNQSHWNQSGAGIGTWKVGELTNPNGPANPTIPGSVHLAGAGLEGNYGKGLDTWLVSPSIDLTSPSDPYPIASFFFAYQLAFDDFFEVAASLDGGVSWLSNSQLSAVAGSGIVTSQPDLAGRPTWLGGSLNLTSFVGAPSVVIGFHLKSVDHTSVSTGAGAFTFSFTVPGDTSAATHIIVARFSEGIPFDLADGVTPVTNSRWDLAYEASDSKEQIRLDVQRRAHFVFELTEAEKIGFRGKSLTIAGRLLDNIGEPLAADPLNPLDRIQVHIEWDPDYNDPYDLPSILQDKKEVDTEGKFDIGYVVSIPQNLGLHNVTFTFAGSRFYTNATGVDVYRLMGHTYVTWPTEADRWVYRLHTAKVTGEIRVIPAESRFDRQRGDPVDGELIRLRWDVGGDDDSEIPPGQVGTITNSTGGFLADKDVRFDAVLGKKQVQLTYPGSDTFTALSSNINWSVVSEVTIQFTNVSVYKGSYLWLNGTMLDDRGVGIDKQTIQIFLDFEQIAVVSTNPDGTYSFPHAIPTDMTVGSKQVLLRFNGNPIYRANETVSDVIVKAHTRVERTDHAQLFDRGKNLNVSAVLYEVYEGNVAGTAVGQEGVGIRIQDRQLTQQRTNSEGKVNFRSAVPADLPWGQTILAFEYNGSEFYDSALNETPIVIRGQAVVSFLTDTLTLNGAPFNVSSDVVHQQEELSGFLQVTDELGVPLGSGDIRLFYAVQAGAGVLEDRRFVEAGSIDDLGRFEFNVTWEDFVVGNRSLIGVFNGSFCPTFINVRTLCLRGGEGNVTVKYEYRQAPQIPPDNTLIYIAIAAVGIIFAGAFYVLWYTAKQRQLQKMQRIIRRAADRLVAGNTYAQAIFEAYRSLARFLQTNGYLRKDSETFREFEIALRQALPIDAKSMDEFLSILEEARYSDHEIGAEQKDRAVATLRAVSASIEQVLLTGQGAVAAPPQAPAPPPPSSPLEPGAPPPT
jgi:hypothetical protein